MRDKFFEQAHNIRAFSFEHLAPRNIIVGA